MRHVPSALQTSAVTAGVLVSLAPSLLPRPPIMQGIVTGILASFAYALAVLAVRGLRGHPREPRESIQVLTLLFSVVVGSWAVIAADHWQDGLRRSMGMTTVGPAHWTAVLASAGLVFLVLLGFGPGLGRFARRIGRFTAATTVVVAVVGVQLVTPAAAGMPSEPGHTLGREGQRFIAAGEHSAGVRTYVGLGSADSPQTRAALAVSELERAGGFDASAVVIAIPTGSGWIDARAAEGIENRFDGDVAIVGVQYSFAPSWVTFLFEREAADRSATALLAAVTGRVDSMPPDRRPDIYVYGQSLGSVGGSAALSHSDAQVCGILWAGPPAGAVNTEGATVLANTSDPVVWWSPELIFTPPDLELAERDAPIPAWIPGVSFVQTSVDLLTALDVPTGHGHRYGTQQGTALPECDTQAGEAMGPRAASYAAPTR